METNELKNLEETQPAEEQSAEEAITEEQPAEGQEPEAQEGETPEGETEEKPKKTLFQEIKEWVFSLIAALVIVLLLQNYVFTLIRVDGASMNPTLVNGERLFVTVADVKFGDVERDDVVICHYPNRGRTFFVKRVVGLPGDYVYRMYGVTHIVHETTDENGEPAYLDTALDQQYVGLFYNTAHDYAPYQLGEDEYFVVGDNRGNSHDSRDWNDSDPSRDVGPISKDMITGRVRCVFWPLSEIRTVE